MSKHNDLLYKITKIKSDEIWGAVMAFVFIFLLMASYFIAKPVRDALASDYSDSQVATLWTFTFLSSIVAVFIYNLFAAKFSLRGLIPGLYCFFALTFTATGIALINADQETAASLGKFFYVWISVFALFHVSVFWSFMSQLYSKVQSKRIFAFINIGASVGAIVGSYLAKDHFNDLPLHYVLFITSGVLIIVLPLIFILYKGVDKESGAKASEFSKLSSNPLSGVRELFSNKSLMGIAGFIFIFVGIGTFFYLAQKDILSGYERSERRALLSELNIYVNVLTVVLGVFATNRIASKFGLSTALAMVPFFVACSFLLFATIPTVAMFMIIEVLRKGGNYSITRPSREILFTAVDQEARFKTKPFIDVSIYRGGDVFWAWFFVLLGSEGVFNLDLPQKLVVGAVIAIVWGVLGIYLGRRYERIEREEEIAVTQAS